VGAENGAALYRALTHVALIGMCWSLEQDGAVPVTYMSACSLISIILDSSFDCRDANDFATPKARSDGYRAEKCDWEKNIEESCEGTASRKAITSLKFKPGGREKNNTREITVSPKPHLEFIFAITIAIVHVTTSHTTEV
jgi:hypothetical protein